MRVCADETNKLQMVLNKAARYGFLPLSWTRPSTIDEMFESSDNTMFLAILRSPDHVLHFLLPPPKTTGHDLRKRGHGLTLTAMQSSLVR